jgi:hypothetical protein
MKISRGMSGIVRGGAMAAVFGLAAAVWPAPANATELIVVDQSMLRFVCMFDADCNGRDTPSDIGALPTARPGSDPRLQSFSFEAKAGTPADGTTVYVYRVDLTKAEPFTECLAGLVLNFGPPAQMPLAIANTAHIFVITTGGNGAVPVKSAEQDGDFIQFNFKDPVCPGQSSMFFGLPSKSLPVSSTATLFGYGSPPISEGTAQTPQHERFAPRNLSADTL